jgi:hypothetical protein
VAMIAPTSAGCCAGAGGGSAARLLLQKLEQGPQPDTCTWNMDMDMDMGVVCEMCVHSLCVVGTRATTVGCMALEVCDEYVLLKR